jgi:hypothetical protein
MVETISSFPLLKLRFEKYLTLDVMKHLEYQEAYKFMFSINKQGRLFLQQNFIPLRNSVINEGIMTYYFDTEETNQLNHYRKLEELYF